MALSTRSLDEVGLMWRRSAFNCRATNSASRVSSRGRPTSASRAGVRRSTMPDRRTSLPGNLELPGLAGRPRSHRAAPDSRPRRSQHLRAVELTERVGIRQEIAQDLGSLQAGGATELGEARAGVEMPEQPGGAEPAGTVEDDRSGRQARRELAVRFWTSSGHRPRTRPLSSAARPRSCSSMS